MRRPWTPERDEAVAALWSALEENYVAQQLEAECARIDAEVGAAECKSELNEWTHGPMNGPVNGSMDQMCGID